MPCSLALITPQMHGFCVISTKIKFLHLLYQKTCCLSFCFVEISTLFDVLFGIVAGRFGAGAGGDIQIEKDLVLYAIQGSGPDVLLFRRMPSITLLPP